MIFSGFLLLMVDSTVESIKQLPSSNLPLPTVFLEFLQKNCIDPSLYDLHDSIPRYIRLYTIHQGLLYFLVLILFFLNLNYFIECKTTDFKMQFPKPSFEGMLDKIYFFTVPIEYWLKDKKRQWIVSSKDWSRAKM